MLTLATSRSYLPGLPSSAYLKQVTVPSSNPVSRAEASAHLRVDGVDDAALIDGLIAAATAEAESLTGRALMSQQWELHLDQFPNAWPSGVAWPVQSWIDLPFPPCVSVDSITYKDASGATQTLVANTDYLTVIPGGPKALPARIVPASGKFWPVLTSTLPDRVTVAFTAGYTTVPEPIKAAIKLMIGDLYANRESFALNNAAVLALLAPYRIIAV